MNIYLLRDPNPARYDAFDSTVVVAKNMAAARLIHPRPRGTWDLVTWCRPQEVEVLYLGKAKRALKEGSYCCSFNAG